MLEYKQKRNNGRTQFAGVYKLVCVYIYTYMAYISYVQETFKF